MINIRSISLVIVGNPFATALTMADHLMHKHSGSNEEASPFPAPMLQYQMNASNFSSQGKDFAIKVLNR